MVSKHACTSITRAHTNGVPWQQSDFTLLYLYQLLVSKPACTSITRDHDNGVTWQQSYFTLLYLYQLLKLNKMCYRLLRMSQLLNILVCKVINGSEGVTVSYESGNGANYAFGGSHCGADDAFSVAYIGQAIEIESKLKA